ncbi:uncharacterized protein [Phyllobates terribilis]|uniref:uncharacterized protein n=1 Tax=Phyllobates terribilis TaxID=111132 RepID=UPI003CCB6437
MELVEILHMNGGDGESSYAENSVIQRKLIRMTKSVKEAAVQRLYSDGVFPLEDGKAVVIAELGCSTGPNALLVAQELISTVDRESGQWSPEYQVLLNDLPGNDFNAIFRTTLPGFRQRLREELGPGFGSCFVSAVPGSFYGRLFPANTLHFVHSSSCLHWLSQVILENYLNGIKTQNVSPRNNHILTYTCLHHSKGDDMKVQVPRGIERSKGKSLESIRMAYSDQFKSDFSTFLKSRAVELVTGGSMVFTLHGRPDHIPPHHEHSFSATWHLLDIALTQMVNQGLIQQEKMDTFNRPLYAPSKGEIQDEIRKEGSFAITDFTSYEVDNWDDIGDDVTLDRRIRYMVTSMRSGTESLLLTHFGDGFCVDELFRRYEEVVRNCLTHDMTKLFMFTVSLAKLNAP